MAMDAAIRNFHKQFAFEPVVAHADKLGKFEKKIVLGMGGSHLAADLLKAWNPALDIMVHADYGLPEMKEETLRRSLVIASSYSGNTEEVLHGFDAARKMGLALSALSVGGELLGRAENAGIPYVKIPDTKIQPRAALGYSINGLLALLGEKAALAEVALLAETLLPERHEAEGKELAGALKGHVPIIYTSRRNQPIGYNWKIKFNETGKIPAFSNIMPELNHNEMTGFDAKESSRALSEKFHFLLLRDADDFPKVQKRMETVARLYQDRGLPVTVLELQGNTRFEKIFSSLIRADWASYYTALAYSLEPEHVPMVEEFKSVMKQI